jgi:hypothetical protein
MRIGLLGCLESPVGSFFVLFQAKKGPGSRRAYGVHHGIEWTQLARDIGGLDCGLRISGLSLHKPKRIVGHRKIGLKATASFSALNEPASSLHNQNARPIAQ